MNESITPMVAKEKIAAAMQRPEQVVRYKDELAYRDAWRISGLSGWIQEQIRPVVTAQSAENGQRTASDVNGSN